MLLLILAYPTIVKICFRLSNSWRKYTHYVSVTLCQAEGLQVWMKKKSAYRGAVAHKDSSCGAVSDVPEANGAVAGACGNVVAVGVPLHHIHI